MSIKIYYKQVSQNPQQMKKTKQNKNKTKQKKTEIIIFFTC